MWRTGIIMHYTRPTYLSDQGIIGRSSLLKHVTIAKVATSEGSVALCCLCCAWKMYNIWTAWRPLINAYEIPMPHCNIHALKHILLTETCGKECTLVPMKGSPVHQSSVLETRVTSALHQSCKKQKTKWLTLTPSISILLRLMCVPCRGSTTL